MYYVAVAADDADEAVVTTDVAVQALDVAVAAFDAAEAVATIAAAVEVLDLAVAATVDAEAERVLAEDVAVFGAQNYDDDQVYTNCGAIELTDILGYHWCFC